MDKSAPWYIYRMVFDARRLVRDIGHRRNLRHKPLDWGYLVHSALNEAFSPVEIKPFAVVSTQGALIEVLGYCDEEDVEVKSGTETWFHNKILSKRMPDKFRPEQRLFFRTRACPVIRQTNPKGKRTMTNSEVDAYLAAVEKGRVGGTREEVYRDWLRERLVPAVELESARMTLFRLSPFLRRDKERRGKKVLRPETVYEGILKVTEPDKFKDLVRKGIGRHKAFGFGMILLKPVR